MKLSSLKVLLKKKKLLSFKRKFRIWVFCAGISKNYYHFRNQYPKIFLCAKFRPKLKNTFRIKNTLFGYF